MSPTEWHVAEDKAYGDRIRGYTLSELEDVYAHLDRTEYPQRIEVVRQELDRRIRALDEWVGVSGDEATGNAGFFRRVWGSLLDFFVQLLILGVLLLIGWGATGLLQGLGAEEDAVQMAAPARPGASPWARFFWGVVQGDLEAWKDVERWGTVGLWALGFLVYRALLTVPVWIRSGNTPGMREVGIRIESAGGGALSLRQALVRFWGHYMLFTLTIGISCLWMLWDPQRRTLHDRLAGTRVSRVARAWEKSAEVRMYDDD